jgi:hypothetical protein
MSISLSWQVFSHVRDGKKAASAKHEALQIRDFRSASINDIARRRYPPAMANR